jgi:hypothetical protein
MKDQSKKELFVVITPEQAAAINGGRGEAEPGDDRGRGRGNDDAPGHG